MNTWSFDERAIEGSPNAFGLPLKRSVSVKENPAARTSVGGGGVFGGFFAADADAVIATIVITASAAGTTIHARCLIRISAP
jgi:hypothetical protein